MHSLCQLRHSRAAFSTGLKQSFLECNFSAAARTARAWPYAKEWHCNEAPWTITHVPLDKSPARARHRLIGTVTCDEFGGLQFILQSNLLPGMNCTVSWTSGISSASSFSDLISSSLWNRDNVWQRNKGTLDGFIYNSAVTVGESVHIWDTEHSCTSASPLLFAFPHSVYSPSHFYVLLLIPPDIQHLNITWISV